jgi:outer membrane protein, multidrug efflux system
MPVRALGLQHTVGSALFTSGLLAACTLQPEYVRPEAPIADQYPTVPDHPAQPVEGTRAADIGWRNFLVDPRLQQLVEVALENNRDLRVAVLNISLVQAQYRISASALYPQISALLEKQQARFPPSVGLFGTSTVSTPTPSTTTGTPPSTTTGGGTSTTGTPPSTTTGGGAGTAGDQPSTTTGGEVSTTGQPSPSSAITFTEYQVGLTASWEVDVFGRVRSLKQAALQQYFASIQGRKAAEILLVSQVADQYLTMLAFDEQLEVTRQTLETARGSYKLVKLQFDAGAASELDLRQSETILEQAQANHAAQLRARVQAENGLVLLLGQPTPPASTPLVRLADQKFLTDIPAGLPSELLIRRPDVLQAEAALRSQNANIGAARAAFFPSIILTGTGGTASSTLDGLFQPHSAIWSWTVPILTPIFTGGANIANLDAAVIRKNIAIAQYEKAIQTAFREVADGLAARATYDEQIAALERNVAAEQRRLDLAQTLFKNGASSYLDVLTAQTALYNAQSTLVTARLARLTSLVDLYRALGGGWLEYTGQTRP